MDGYSLSNIIRSIVREHHWTPDTIDRFYFDYIDHHGLLFWFEDLQEMDKQINKKTS